MRSWIALIWMFTGCEAGDDTCKDNTESDLGCLRVRIDVSFEDLAFNEDATTAVDWNLLTPDNEVVREGRSPLNSVEDEAYDFSVLDVPPGEYRFRCWDRSLGTGPSPTFEVVANEGRLLPCLLAVL